MPVLPDKMMKAIQERWGEVADEMWVAQV